MRIYKYLFFLGLLAFSACIGEDKVPGNVLSEDQMPLVIADIHIVDGDLYNVPQTPDSLYKYSMGHYLAIFKKYDTDSVQFKRSYTWYTKHPVKLDEVYDEVVKILQAKNDSIGKIKPPPVKVPVTTAITKTPPATPPAPPVKKDSVIKPVPVKPIIPQPKLPGKTKRHFLKPNQPAGRTPFKHAD